MGNSKSRKMKISQIESQNNDENTERINTIKSEIPVNVADINREEGGDQNKDKENDNASSASTVEVLDDKNAAARANGERSRRKSIKLYHLSPSPPCRVVRLTAKLLGINLELIITNILEGEHKTPEYSKMNPQQTIPTMDDNGFILWESRAIIAYLVNAYGKDDSLYPKDPRERALVDQRLNYDVGTLYPRYVGLYIPMLFRGEPYDEEKAKDLKEALNWLNLFLEDQDFVAGDHLTIADMSIVVTITNLDVLGFDFSAYTNVANWFERMKSTLEPHGYHEIDRAGAEILASFLKKD